MKCLKLTRWKSIAAGITFSVALISCGDANRGGESVTLNSTDIRATEMQPAEALNLLHKTNLKEVALGNLAKGQAKSEEVKALGEQLAVAHAAVDAKVIETAKGLEIELAEFDAAGDAAVEKLKALEAEAFDKAFLETMVAEHEALIKQIDGVKISDAKVQALLTELLPSLKAHQAKAKSLLGSGSPEGGAATEGGASTPGGEVADAGDKGQKQQDQKQEQAKPEQGQAQMKQ